MADEDEFFPKKPAKEGQKPAPKIQNERQEWAAPPSAPQRQPAPIQPSVQSQFIPQQQQQLALGAPQPPQPKALEGQEFYDIVIRADSLKNGLFSEGWPVRFNPYFNQEQMNSRNAIFCVVGNHNKGKSWLLSYLTKQLFPSGYNRTTEGFSIKYPRGDVSTERVIWLDSAGFEVPVTMIGEREELQDRIKERRICEDILQNFMVESSQFVFLIVDQLTYSDQILFSRLSSKLKALERDKKHRRLIVLHNFSKLETIPDVKKQIEIDIEKIFDVTSEVIPKVGAVSTTQPEIAHFYKEKKSNIIHLVMAKDGSAAGKSLNPIIREYITSILQVGIEYHPWNPASDLAEFIKKYLPNFANYDGQEIGFSKEKSKIFASLKEGVNEPKFELKPITSDPFGQLLAGSGDEPPYSMIDDGENLQLILDLIGWTEQDLRNIVVTIIPTPEGHQIIAKGQREKTLEEAKQDATTQILVQKRQNLYAFQLKPPTLDFTKYPDIASRKFLIEVKPNVYMHTWINKVADLQVNPQISKPISYETPSQ